MVPAAVPRPNLTVNDRPDRTAGGCPVTRIVEPRQSTRLPQPLFPGMQTCDDNYPGAVLHAVTLGIEPLRDMIGAILNVGIEAMEAVADVATWVRAKFVSTPKIEPSPQRQPRSALLRI